MVILDDRMKDISQLKAVAEDASDEEADADIYSVTKQPQKEEHSSPALTKISALKEIRRVPPTGIIGFFECASSS